MKLCNECKQPNEFRKWRRVCIVCDRKHAIERYYTQKQNDPTFLQKHSEKERLNRRTPKGCQYALYSRAKSRAKRYQLDFNIVLDDIIVPERCPILGIPLVVSETMSDCSPSLDRIIPSVGYVKGNIQVISAKANTIKSNDSLDELEKVYLWMKNFENNT
jgi:hypothetical protein